MTKEVARPGQSLQRHLTASFVNELKKNRRDFRVNRHHTTENPAKIRARIVTDSDLTFQRFDPANIVGPFAESDNDFKDGMWATVGVTIDDTLVANRWGVTQGLIREGISDYVTVVGMTWALFNYTEGHTHVTVQGGVLTSSTSGEAVIIFPPTDTDEPGLILLRGGSGGSATNIIQGRLIDLAEGSGEAEGYMVGTIEVVRTSCGATSFSGSGSGSGSGSAITGEIQVVDWSECIFDRTLEELLDVWVWAVEDWQENPNFGEYDPRTHICGWATLNRCCVSADNAGSS